VDALHCAGFIASVTVLLLHKELW